MEQITYLLFIKRLDELHTLEESKAATLKLKKLERRIFPEGKDGRGKTAVATTMTCAGRGSRHFEAREMFKVVDEHVFPFIREQVAKDGAVAKHMQRRTLRHSDAGAARQGRRQARQGQDGRSRHQRRRLRIHARQDRERRPERPVPHAAPHHQADGRADQADADRCDLRSGGGHLRLPGRGGRIPARAPQGIVPRRETAASTSTRTPSTASTSTRRCCASAR